MYKNAHNVHNVKNIHMQGTQDKVPVTIFIRWNKVPKFFLYVTA